MELGLTGQRALVTGSSRGIGRAIAMQLAEEGVEVAINGRTDDTVQAVIAEIAAAGGKAVAVLGDVTTPKGATAVVNSAAEQLSGLDIVVNNVGGSGARTIDGLTDADLDSVLSRNLWPAHRVSRAALPHLQAAGSGVVILIASIWGREAGGGPSYNIAKAAEISLGKALAHGWATHGIRVNTVAPGSILFPGGGWERRQQADPEGIAELIKRELPFGRFGTPEEVANVVAFLCSDRASWMSGACVVVDGAQSRMF